VWLAIGAKARKPTVTDPPLRIVRFSDRALRDGVQTRTIEGVAVKVTTAARTVADCFKYRNKIGLDVALEALREYRRAGRSMDDLARGGTRHPRVQRDASLSRSGARVKSKTPRDRAASVRQRLLSLAKTRGEEFNFVLLRYGAGTISTWRPGRSRWE
jgi:predicted transcriptional regulator of viral defense system